MGLLSVIVVAAVLVLVLGLVIFKLLRRNQDVVPDMADRHAARRDQVVAVDDEGRPVMASEEDEPAPPDDAAFEGVLKDQLDDLHR